MSLISLLVVIVVLGLVYWLITMLPIPAPFNTIILVVFIIICILVLLSVIGVVDIGNIRVR